MLVCKMIQNILRIVSPLVIDDVTLHINTQRDTNTYIIAYDLWSGNTSLFHAGFRCGSVYFSSYAVCF